MKLVGLDFRLFLRRPLRAFLCKSVDYSRNKRLQGLNNLLNRSVMHLWITLVLPSPRPVPVPNSFNLHSSCLDFLHFHWTIPSLRNPQSTLLGKLHHHRRRSLVVSRLHRREVERRKCFFEEPSSRLIDNHNVEQDCLNLDTFRCPVNDGQKLRLRLTARKSRSNKDLL